MTIIAVTTAPLTRNGIGCWKATRNSCIVAAMLADGRAPFAVGRRVRPPSRLR
jgi:hypothetical protein